MDLDYQEFDIPNIDARNVDSPLLLINSQQSTIDKRLLMVKCGWIWTIKRWQHTISILWMLMVHSCWSTLISLLLRIKYWWPTVDEPEPSRFDSPNIYDVNVDGPLQLVNSWQSTIDHQLRMFEGWWIWTIKGWQSKSKFCEFWWPTFVGQILSVHCYASTIYCQLWMNLDHQELTVQISML